MAWFKCRVEKGDVMLSGPYAMCVKHPTEVLTLYKHVRREIVNMVYPTDSILVIQTMNGKHVVKYRFDVSHLETKKDKILVEVLERIRVVHVYSCFCICTCFVVTTMCFMLFMYSCFFHVVRVSLVRTT